MTTVKRSIFSFLRRDEGRDIFNETDLEADREHPWQGILADAAVRDDFKAPTADEEHRASLMQRQTELYERDAIIVASINRLTQELSEVRHTIRSIEKGLSLINEDMPAFKALPTLVESRRAPKPNKEPVDDRRYIENIDGATGESVKVYLDN